MKKIALVTGGSGGIGEAVCRKLAGDGYFVIVNYSKSADKAREIADSINGCPLKFNVADRQEVLEAIEYIRKNFGLVSLLVNNAGVSAVNLYSHS